MLSEDGFDFDDPPAADYPPTKPVSKLALCLLAPLVLVVLLGGLALICLLQWWYVDLLWSHYAMRSWEEVPAVILKTELQEHRSSRSVTYRTTAEYAYDFQGQPHTSIQVDWMNGSDDIGPFQRRIHDELREHQASGRPFRCFVNPLNPAQAVLYRDMRPELLVLFAATELLLGLTMIFIIAKRVFSLATGRGKAKIPRGPAGQETAGDAPPDEQIRGEITRSNRENAIWTTLFAVAWNVVALPLYFYLPTAPRTMLWPSLVGAALAVIGWIIIWRAIWAWRQVNSGLWLE